MEVITHTDPLNVAGWTGAGYILLDPGTGEGSYKISGGLNGGIFKLKYFKRGFSFLIGVLVLAGSGGGTCQPQMDSYSINNI